jgi:putative flippase GtrA
MNIAVRYISFSIFATVVNISSQYVSFYIYNGFLNLYLAMFVGTLSGLILKYILDKKYIFYYNSKSRQYDGITFSLYSLTGIITTFIFWGFEMSFDYIFEDKNAKYLGAVIGLSIGYTAKYFLDKELVFKH